MRREQARSLGGHRRDAVARGMRGQRCRQRAGGNAVADSASHAGGPCRLSDAIVAVCAAHADASSRLRDAVSADPCATAATHASASAPAPTSASAPAPASPHRQPDSAERRWRP
jgi:hypothetical protein